MIPNQANRSDSGNSACITGVGFDGMYQAIIVNIEALKLNITFKLSLKTPHFFVERILPWITWFQEAVAAASQFLHSLAQNVF